MKGNFLGQFMFIALCVFITGGSLFAIGGQQNQTVLTGARPTLEIALGRNNNVTDYDDNYMTKRIENAMNVDLVFNFLTDMRTRIPLMVASDSLPETIWNPGLSAEQILDFGSNGFFLPLNKYMDNPAVMPHFNNIPADYRKKMKSDTVSANGVNYDFPRHTPESWNVIENRHYINRQWLTKLGLNVPTTTEEFRNVLRAFRTRDPNGNGRPDEIGVFGMPSTNENSTVAIINWFQYYHTGRLVLDETGNTVIAPFNTPAFRMALQYLNSLFNEGLLDASLFTNDQQVFRSILNADPMVVGFSTVGSMAHWPNTDTNPNFLAMAPLVGPMSSPASPGYIVNSLYNTNRTTYLTNKLKNVDLAVRVIDYFYEPDMSIISRYGEEGVHWLRDPESLAKGSNAYKHLGLISDLSMVLIRDISTAPHNSSWQGGAPRFTTLDFLDAIGFQNFDHNSPTQMAYAYNYQLYFHRRPQHILPVLQFNLDDAMSSASTITTINAFVPQAIAEFTTGIRDINSDTAWNSYVNELNRMGLQEWIRIAQATYNRQR